jgi:hypothetical protein
MSVKEGPNFKKVKISVENVTVSGLNRTNDEYVKNQLLALFKANNFEQLLEATSIVRERLSQLGCFKSIEAIIDKSNGLRLRAFSSFF